MFNFIPVLTSGCFFILAFIVASNPRKANIYANRWLAVFLLCIAIILIDDPLIYGKFYHQYPIFIGLVNIPIFAIAPVLYFSISFFVSPVKTFIKRDLWHFALLIVMSLLIVLSMFIPAGEKVKDLDTPTTQSDLISGLILIIFPLAVYWILSYKKLIKHQKNVRLFASNTEGVDLAWLRHFLWGLAVMLVAWFCELVWSLPSISEISNLIYLASAFYLAYFALQQGEVFSEKPQEALDLKTIIEENEQIDLPKKQVLTTEQLTVLKAKLSDLMQTEKPYLDSNLSLPKLAQIMQVSTHELSYLINTGFEDNFFGFVNRYRVEESKHLLTSPQCQHLSMIGIAFEAGFNSKTAFNTAFKKIVGVSPTEFQKLNIR